VGSTREPLGPFLLSAETYRGKLENLAHIGRRRAGFGDIGNVKAVARDLGVDLGNAEFQRRHHFGAAQEKHERCQRHDRLGIEGLDGPERLPQEAHQLHHTQRRRLIGRALRPIARSFRAGLLDIAVLLEGFQCVVDRAGLDIGPLIDMPGHQLAPQKIAMYRLELPHGAEDHKAGDIGHVSATPPRQNPCHSLANDIASFQIIKIDYSRRKS
jgi:hypothetical protein